MTFNAWTLASASALALLAPVAVQAQSAQGMLQGQVVSALTGEPLAGAEVAVVGGPRTTTDEAGRFQLTGVAAGPQVVRASYLGLPASEASVSIQAGAAAQATLRLGDAAPTTLSEVVVTSQRTARDAALNRYRAADSISNYLAADDVGQFVDQNVAESLSRLPGTSITRDQGEGRFVSVRGVPAGLSTVTINGMRIGTPEDGSRAVPLDVIPAGSIELLEVTKVPTPDMPGDAIGGSIDVRSGSPFNENDKYRFRYRLEGQYAELSEDVNTDARLNFSDLFKVGAAEENFGVSFGVNYLRRDFESNNIEAVYESEDENDIAGLVIEEVDMRKYAIERERLGANLNLEYRPTADDTFYLNALYSKFEDAEARQRSGFVLADGDLVSFDGTTAVYEDVPSDAFRRRIRYRTKKQDTLAASFGGEHRRGLWTIDYTAGHSITDENVGDEIEGRFEGDFDDLTIVAIQGGGRPSLQVLNGATPDTGYLDNANFVLDRVVLAPTFVDDNDSNASFNVTRESAFGLSGLTLKAGLDYRTKSKDVDVGETELRRTPDATLDQFGTSARDYPFGALGDGISSQAFVDFFNQGGFSERPQDVEGNLVLNVANDYQADEDVSAAYVMGTWDTGPWRVIAGVRAERTEYSADGSELSYDENGDLTVSARSVSKDYTNVLPSLHLRYTPRENVILRAAWSNTIARPSFGDISPRFEINNENQRIDAGNPDLEPYESSNFDLMADWYTGGGSILSLGVFTKDIDNYIVDRTINADPDFGGYRVTRPVNGSSASIDGIELNLEQDLGRVVGAMDGFLVGANATFLDTSFTVDGRSESFSLPQAPETTVNLYAGYEAGPFSARVSYAFRGEYMEEIGDGTAYDIYVKESEQLDLTASYRLNDHLELMIQGKNLLNDPLELYQGTPATSLQFEEYGSTYAFVLKGRF
jgi:TonB-dependent receptor